MLIIIKISRVAIGHPASRGKASSYALSAGRKNKEEGNFGLC